MNTEISPETVKSVMEKMLEGFSMAEASGISEEAIEAGYSLAFSLYNSGNFKDAETMFQALCLYDHRDERFWMGLGGSRQMNDKLEQAIDAYNMASFSGALQNPAPAVHAGLCYLKLGDKKNACALFDAALELGEKDSKEHKAIREKAQAMLELIKREDMA